MASSDEVSRTTSAQGPRLEAHSILQHGPSPTQRQPSGSSIASSQGAMKGKRAPEYLEANRPHAYSSSSRNTTQSSASTKADNRSAQREVRTLPRKSFTQAERLRLNH